MSQASYLNIKDMWDEDSIEKGGICDKHWCPAKGFWLLKLFKPGAGRTLGRCYTLQINNGCTFGYWDQTDRKMAEACFVELKRAMPLDIGNNAAEFEAAAEEVIRRYLA